MTALGNCLELEDLKLDNTKVVDVVPLANCAKLYLGSAVTFD